MGWDRHPTLILQLMTSSVSPQLIETPTPALGDFFSYPTQVFFASVRSGGSSQVYFMTLNRNCIMNW